MVDFLATAGPVGSNLGHIWGPPAGGIAGAGGYGDGGVVETVVRGGGRRWSPLSPLHLFARFLSLIHSHISTYVRNMCNLVYVYTF